MMAQSDVSPSATAESKIDTPKAALAPCLQLPGGDGGGFHVAKGCLHTATGRKLDASDFMTGHFSGRLVPPQAWRRGKSSRVGIPPSPGLRTGRGKAAGNYGSRRIVPAYRPSQLRTPASTKASCWTVNRPRNRSAFAAEIVMGFWTRKAPDWRKGTSNRISRSEPRNDVVWGITVISARSWSLKER